MTFRLLTPLAALFLAVTAAAQMKLNSVSAGSQTFSNVVVLGFNPTDLYFTHAAGIANVKLKLLDAPLREQFHYDPVVTAEAERQQAESDARYIEGVGREIKAEARRKAPATRGGPRMG